MVLDKSFLDALNEENVQSRVDNKNDDFRGRIPTGIDLNKSN